MRSILATILTLVFVSITTAQPPVAWVKRFDLGETDKPGDILALNDHSALVIGTSRSGIWDDWFGEREWRISKFGDSISWPYVDGLSRKGVERIQASNRNFYQVGLHFIDEQAQFLFTRYDSSGNMISDQADFNPYSQGRLSDIKQTGWGGLVVVGGATPNDEDWGLGVLPLISVFTMSWVVGPVQATPQ